jgi:hypothetical protein
MSSGLHRIEYVRVVRTILCKGPTGITVISVVSPVMSMVIYRQRAFKVGVNYN